MRVNSVTLSNGWNTCIDIETQKITKNIYSRSTDVLWWSCDGFLVASSSGCYCLLLLSIVIVIGDVRTSSMHSSDQLRYERIAFRLEFRPKIAEYATTTYQKREKKELQKRNFLLKANCALTLLSRAKSAPMCSQPEEQNDFIVSTAYRAPDYGCNLCLRACHGNGFRKCLDRTKLS